MTDPDPVGMTCHPNDSFNEDTKSFAHISDPHQFIDEISETDKTNKDGERPKSIKRERKPRNASEK